jgi:hypothetical protein
MGGVTADSTLRTADSTCWTADGRIICIDADVAEAAVAFDQLDAVADVAATIVEATTALDNTDAAVGANIVFADVAEAATALDQLDADVVAAEVPVVIGGGGRYYPPQRPFPVVGRGYGILPQLEGEAHGVVGVAGKSAAQLVVRADAVGACGQAGNAAAVIKGVSVTAKGAVGARGTGSGVIMKFSGSATGHHDDDEAAVIAFLLAA